MQLRLIPILLFGIVSLLLIKGLDIFMGEGTQVSTSAHASGAPKAAPQIGTAERPAEVNTSEKINPTPADVPAEKALNDRLSERRRLLDERTKELEMRENLLKAAEKRLEDRLEEMKRIETRVGASSQNREEEKNASIKSIVTMYESMKPKDAARIFDKLDMEVMIEVVTRMNPKKMADVLAEMQSETAQRLTVELARRSNVQAKSQPGKGVPAAPPANGRELQRIDQRTPG